MKRALFFFFIIIQSLILAATGQYDTDSLINALKKPGLSDLSRVKILLNISYQNVNNPTESYKYAHDALQLAIKINNEEMQAIACNYCGNAEIRLGNKVVGIEYVIKSANLFRKNGMVHAEAFALTSIADVFGVEKDIENALKYYKQALASYNEYGDTFYVANTLGNLGESYRNIGQFDSALYYSNQSLNKYASLFKQDQAVEKNMQLINGNKALIFAQLGDFEKAKNELKKAVDYFQQTKDYSLIAVYQSEFARLLIRDGNTDEGERLLKASLEIVKPVMLKEQIRDLNYYLFELYESQGKTALAFDCFKNYKQYDDSVKNIENVRRLEQLQSKFELNRKEEEISLLHQSNILQRYIAMALSFGVLVFVVLLFLLYRNILTVKKANLIISEQKELVEKREKEKGLLLRELNHRVKNNLQMIASLLNLHARQIHDKKASDALLAGKFRVEALTLLHQNLYREDIDTQIDIKIYVEELVQNLVFSFGQNFKPQLNLQSCWVNLEKAVPLGLIINELITNSLKYAKKNNDNPILGISIFEVNEKLFIHVTDNGTGLPADFDLQKASSFGLKLVNSLVNQLKGEIQFENNNGVSWKLIFDKEKIA